MSINSNVNSVEYVQEFLFDMYSIYKQKYEKTGQSSVPEVSSDSSGKKKSRIWSLLRKGKQTVSQSTNYSQFYNYIKI